MANVSDGGWRAAVGGEGGFIESSELADAEIKAAFGDFDTLWKSVSQREQGKLMEVLVERVEYDPHDVAISVSFHRTGIKTLAAKADEVLV